MTFTALAAGVSGLQAFGEGVGVIADNITNVNTIGYKETRSRFSTLVTETSTRSSYSPGGVRAFAQSLVSKQGLLQPSSSDTDLAVDGAGFFVVKKADDALSDGEIQFTRAGAFSQDPDGYFRNTSGLFLLGYPLDSAGNLVSNDSQDSDSLEPINIAQLNGVADATSNVSLRVNLQASTAQSGLYTPGTDEGEFAAGNITPDFTTNIQIFDSLGVEHTVNVAASKTGASTWSYEYYFDDPTALDGTHTDGLIGYGQLVFNADGSIDTGSSTLFDIGDNAVDFVNGEALSFTYDNTENNVEAGSIVIDFGSDGDTDGWTQNESDSILISSSVDGASFENVSGISIDEDGIVSALFDNGLSLAVYQLPIAIFDNPDGLQRLQGNAYGASDNSGRVTYQFAGAGGAGSVAPNSLEMSTVDIANEFAELIKVQRAFSASTRIITTADEILEELTRL